MAHPLIPAPIFERIIPSLQVGYNVGVRHYHTIDHAYEVLEHVMRLHQEVGFLMPVEAAIAALYHDVVYIPGNPTNEDESVIKMLEDMSTLSKLFDVPVAPSRIAYLIWLTKYHFKMGGLLDDDLDAQLFLDCDIMGFSANYLAFKSKNALLEKEFLPLSKGDRKDFIIGRMAFLQNIRSNTGVFNSRYMQEVGEAQAISNIETSLMELERELSDMGASWNAVTTVLTREDKAYLESKGWIEVMGDETECPTWSVPWEKRKSWPEEARKSTQHYWDPIEALEFQKRIDESNKLRMWQEHDTPKLS